MKITLCLKIDCCSGKPGLSVFRFCRWLITAFTDGDFYQLSVSKLEVMNKLSGAEIIIPPFKLYRNFDEKRLSSPLIIVFVMKRVAKVFHNPLFFPFFRVIWCTASSEHIWYGVTNGYQTRTAPEPGCKNLAGEPENKRQNHQKIYQF